MSGSRSSDDEPKSTAPSDGPIDGNTWPSQLTGRVVDPGPPARIHGYEVEADLAPNYRFTDLLRLALAGELPCDAESRAFDLALQLLAPIDVTCAPAHAGVLARICGARSSATIGVAALALAEEARALVAEHAALLSWLDVWSSASPAAFPAAFVATSVEDVRAAAGLHAAVGETGLAVPALAASPTRTAGLLAIVHACGLRRAEQIEAVLVLARLPCVLGEAFAASAGAFQSYPMRLPPFRHDEIR
jgi:hypothetical protein